MAAVIMALSLILVGDGSTFNSNQEYEFQDDNIFCNNGESCTVTCDETGACQNSNIHCPQNDLCSVICSGRSSCNFATIHWPNDNSLGDISCRTMEPASCYEVNFPIPSSNESVAFNCDGWECERAIIYCPTDGNCKITCNGEVGCANSQIHWSNNGSNELICNGPRSCQGIDFPVPTDDYHFVCDEVTACESANIYCPANKDCHIECIQDYACEETIIHWSSNRSVIANLTCGSALACIGAPRPPVFATNDDENFYINCTDNYQCHYSVIYCPINAECHITCIGNTSCHGILPIWPNNYAYSLICDPYDSSCVNIIHTSNPTIEPTSIPTFNPTSIPTFNPTSIPTFNPTSIPTFNPTSIPTFNHTSNPTFNPTSNPPMTSAFNTTINSAINPSENAPITPSIDTSNKGDMTTIYVVSISAAISIVVIIAVIIITQCHRRMHQKDTSHHTEVEISSQKNVVPPIHNDDVLKTINYGNNGDNDSDGMYNDKNNFDKRGTNANDVAHGENGRNSDSNDLYKNEDDTKDNIETKGTKRNDEEEHDNQLEGKKEETDEEYERITNMLKEIVYGEWKRYLRNFKKHKVNDQRLKLIGNNNSDIWQQLIPEIGIRLQFYALLQTKQNDGNTKYL